MKISAAMVHAYEFACYSKACAPPPAGSGGSNSKGGGGNTLLNASKAVANRSGNGGAANARAFLNRPQVKDGVVHAGGKQITGKIRKVGGVYEATMRGSQHKQDVRRNGEVVSQQRKVLGRTKAEVASNAAKIEAEAGAKTRQAGAISKAAPSHSTSRVMAMPAVRAETLGKIGPVKAKDIKVTRDGAVAAKGTTTDMKITRGGDGKGKTGWTATGQVRQLGTKGSVPIVFKTQAAAKAAVARDITSASKFYENS